jgi:hypothetical protein
MNFLKLLAAYDILISDNSQVICCWFAADSQFHELAPFHTTWTSGGLYIVTKDCGQENFYNVIAWEELAGPKALYTS